MLNVVKSLVVMISTIFLANCASAPKRVGNDLRANSVKITNMAANSGGTGIVLRSSPVRSYVLTNAHVCGVVEKGGLVSGMAGSYTVVGYKKSESSDLCLIKVSGDLGYNTKLSKRLPRLFYEKASVSGHPALMPNIVTEGHFSGREVVPILVGFKECTPEDAQDPQKGPLCFMLGGLPIIKEFESILVSATIMPGSSGSGVYNEDRELAGVVFAGSGQLGYAWTVPYEQVVNFLFAEQKSLKYEKPTNTVDIFQGGGAKSKLEDSMILLKKVCGSADRTKVESLCQLLDSSLIK